MTSPPPQPEYSSAVSMALSTYIKECIAVLPQAGRYDYYREDCYCPCCNAYFAKKAIR